MGQQAVRPVGVSALGTRACEHPILGLRVRAVLLPAPKVGGKNWVHGYRFSRRLSLAVADDIQIDRASHIDLQAIKINIFPL